jgi:hypothetical protein
MCHATSSALAYLCLCLLLVPLSHAQDRTALSGKLPNDAPQTITLAGETANNTGACLAPGQPSYCTAALPSLKTSLVNQTQASPETLVTDAPPRHVSNISLHSLMYANWKGKIICAYQPWFSTAPGNNGHIPVGYDETNALTVTTQDTTMNSRGCDINLIDFYGSTDGQTFIENATNTIARDLKARSASGFPLKFGIMEDQHATDAQCQPYVGQAPLLIACLETYLIQDMNYINANYATNPAYWLDGGQPVVAYFGAVDYWKPTLAAADWNTIWQVVKTYTNTFSTPFKFVFQFGSYSMPASMPALSSLTDGEYAWPQPYADLTSDNDGFIDNPPSQFYWCDGTGITCNGHTAGYLDNFYYQGHLNPQKLTIGLLYKGFDDSNASWGTDRVIAQQCGQVWLNSPNEVTLGGYWGPTNQIPYMLVTTWNDYEEGTAIESGINNCYSQLATTLPANSSTLSWTLTSSDATYATIKTINHYSLWTAPHGTAALTLTGQVKSTSTQIDLSTLPLTKGTTYDVYLEMIGQPSIQNLMSNAVTYTP